MYFPDMKLGSKVFLLLTFLWPPKTETAGPPGERVQPFGIPAPPESHQCPD